MSEITEVQKRKIEKLLLESSSVQVYQMVLEGRLRQFPSGFWAMPENHQYARDCTRYMIEHVLRWNRADICNNLTKTTFKEYKLGGMFSRLFEKSTYKCICNAYPNEFFVWEFKNINAPKNYWTEEVVAKSVRHIIKKYNWSRNDVCKKFSYDFLCKVGLKPALDIVCDCSPYKALNLAYPNEFKQCELANKPSGYWKDKTNIIEAVKWCVEEKYKWNRDEVCKYFSKDYLEAVGISAMWCNDSICKSLFECLDLAYPNEFKPWELNGTSKNFWTPENGRRATRWLIEEKLKARDLSKVPVKLFREYNLNGMLTALYGGSHIKALKDAYPTKYIC